jgi:hypothetical protein
VSLLKEAELKDPLTSVESWPKSRSFPTTLPRSSTSTFLNYNTGMMGLSSPAPNPPTSQGQTRTCTPIRPCLSQIASLTDSLKWKPPSENSIDFKLQLRFPPSPHDPSQPDFYAKPVGLLYTWLGRDDYEFFDEMELDDDEWKAWKESGEQFDDRIIEVSWDNDRSTWKYLRIRDDKPHANHKNIMKKIMVSITDGVEIEAVSIPPTFDRKG